MVSDRPDGGISPLVNGPVTPADWMCLDGSLYVDDSGTPWLLFCREWLEVGNGEVYLQQLANDLKTTVGDPILLLNAGSAAWTGTITVHGTTGYVTDAPFVFKAMNGHLLMLWSSFTKPGKYAPSYPVLYEVVENDGNLTIMK